MAVPETGPDGRAEPRIARIRDTAAQDVAMVPPRRRHWLRWAVLVLVLVLVALAWPALSRWSSSELSVPLERLRVAEVSRQTFLREVAVRGTVVAAVSPTLYAPADGIASLHVQAGDLVANGDPLVTIASPQLENQLALERATLDSMNTALERQRIDMRIAAAREQQTVDQAKVSVVAAERELRRAQAAWDARVISEQDYDKARDDLDKARLEYEHVQRNAELDAESLAFNLRAAGQARDRQQLLVGELERRLAELAIASPVDGMVGTVVIQERQAVTANAPLVTVVDLSAFEIEMTVPESYADDLAPGLPAVVEIGRAQFTGQVRSISPEVEEGQVRGRVRFAGAAPEGLRQNQRVSVRLQLDTRPDALVVRRGPFYDDGAGRVAYVVDGDLARRRAIRTGAVSIDQVEILDGLAAGERVVISSYEPFRGADTVLLSQ